MPLDLTTKKNTDAYSHLLTEAFDPSQVYELSVVWPTSSKRMTYLGKSASSYEHLGLVIEAAKDVEAESLLRIYKSDQSNNVQCETVDLDALKLSSRAVEQFQKHAPEALKAAVAGLLSRANAAVRVGQSRGSAEIAANPNLLSALLLVRPYSAYRVQAADEADGGKTVAIDFDGVLASYAPGQYPAIGEPLPGAIDALWQLYEKGYILVILSSRALKPEGRTSILDWLESHGAPDVVVTGEKIPAAVYLDDRARRFHGWEGDLPLLLSVLEQDQSPDLSAKFSHLCREDKSILSRVGSKYVCPACDTETGILQNISATLYTYASGDKVHVKSEGSSTVGDAFLISKASEDEELALRGKNLWLVKFADGATLPVSEDRLSKIGHDLRIQRLAEDVILGYEKKLSQVGELAMAYDLDNVVESALEEASEGIIPADAVLVSVGTRHGLSPDDLDFVAEQLLGPDSKTVEATGPSLEQLKNCVKDAVVEVNARYVACGLTANAEEEADLVLSYVAEEYELKSEAVNTDLENKVRDLIIEVKGGKKVAETQDYHPTDTPSLTSVPEGEYDQTRFQTTADEGNVTTLFIAIHPEDDYVLGASMDANARYPQYWAHMVVDYPKTVEVAIAEKVPQDLANKLLAQGTGDQSFSDGYEAFSAVEKYLYRPYKGKHSYPAYDDKTSADKKAEGGNCINCGSISQDGVRCCDNPRRGPGEGDAMQGRVKESAKETKCISCGKSIPVEKGIVNEHGAGYLCSACAPEWNLDKKEASETKEAATCPLCQQSFQQWTEYDSHRKNVHKHSAMNKAADVSLLMRGNAYVMQYLDSSDIRDDSEVRAILDSNASDGEKIVKITQRARTLITEKSNDEADIKSVDWSAPEIQDRFYTMVYDAIEDHRDLNSESSLKRKAMDIESVLRGYLAAAVWSTTNMETGESWDTTRGINDFSRAAVDEARKVVTQFIQAAGSLLDGMDPDQVGHDIWLTRNGHGAGFWDRGLGEKGEQLTQLAQALGEDDIYADDSNGELHFEREAKLAMLNASLKGITLDDEQKRIVASIYDSLSDFEPDFLRSVGQFFTYEWDPGASWEVRDIAGKKQIVRKDVVSKKEVPMGRHAYKEGQVLKMYTSFFPTDVKIIALVGNDRYQVKSSLDGSMLICDEDDLMMVEDKNKDIFN